MVNFYEQMEKIKNSERFVEATGALKSGPEFQALMRDLMTAEEMMMYYRRLQVAALLEAGWTYEAIHKELSVGMGKIAAVKKAMDSHGEGYRAMVKRNPQLAKSKKKS